MADRFRAQDLVMGYRFSNLLGYLMRVALSGVLDGLFMIRCDINLGYNLTGKEKLLFNHGFFAASLRNFGNFLDSGEPPS